jgi:ABC-type glycerol-3-phosphate transport system substrate-binding protein
MDGRLIRRMTLALAVGVAAGACGGAEKAPAEEGRTVAAESASATVPRVAVPATDAPPDSTPQLQ